MSQEQTQREIPQETLTPDSQGEPKNKESKLLVQDKLFALIKDLSCTRGVDIKQIKLIMEEIIQTIKEAPLDPLDRKTRVVIRHCEQTIWSINRKGNYDTDMDDLIDAIRKVINILDSDTIATKDLNL